MPRLTVAEAHRVIVDYIKANPTQTYTAVAEHFGYSPTQISTIAQAAGLPKRKRGTSLSKLEAK